jgi:protein SCO1
MKFKKFLKNPFLWAFLVGVISLHVIKDLALRRRFAPPAMVTVPDWNLLDQNGNRFGKKDLVGKIVIMDFFFTSCPSICPKLTQAMKDVYERFKNKEKDVHFIGISVDPKKDTPAVLKNFMKENGVQHENWHCLTGTKKEIYEVVVEKMRVHLGEKQAIDGVDDLYDIPHLAHLALFDKNGDLRGLFNTENIELASLVRAANFLLEAVEKL